MERKMMHKVCLLGEMGVGKTSLVLRFKTQSYNVRYSPTYFAHHCYRTVKTDEGDAKLVVWDTAGSERYRSINSFYVRDAACCLLVFSLTDPKSFQEIVNYWWPQTQQWSPDTFGVLVGTKVDNQEERAISSLEVKKFCNMERLRYFETSALTGEKVEDCFTCAAKLSIRSKNHGENFIDSFQLHDLKEKGDKMKIPKCC